MVEPIYVTPREAAKEFQVTVQTLRFWERDGLIKAIRTPSGQRRYDITSYKAKQSADVENAQERVERATLLYARVSSRKQKADLDRQIATLLQLYPNGEIISDIGSGLNFRRLGLQTLLGRVRSGDVGLVVVAHKDRLARFGFDHFKWLCEQDNCRLLVLNQDNLSPEREMVEDILAIVHIFSCRLYGLRKYKRFLQEDQELQAQNAPSPEETSRQQLSKNQTLSR